MEPGRGPTVETVCPAEHEIRALPNVRRIIVVMIHEPLHFISKGEIKGIKEKTKAVMFDYVIKESKGRRTQLRQTQERRLI